MEGARNRVVGGGSAALSHSQAVHIRVEREREIERERRREKVGRRERKKEMTRVF